MINQRKNYLWNLALWLICCTTCIGFSQQTRREEYDTRLIVAEVEPQSNVLKGRKTMQEVINELRNEGYRLIREKDIVYALPRRYFDTYESLMTILAEIRPFEITAKEEISEDAKVAIRSLLEKYGNRERPFNSACISFGIFAVAETGDAVYQTELVQPEGGFEQVHSFFTKPFEEWKARVLSRRSPAGNWNSLPEEIREKVRELIQQYPALAQGSSTKSSSVSKVSRQTDNNLKLAETKILHILLSPSILLSNEQKVRYNARYYQILERELKDQQVQWTAALEKLNLLQRRDWRNWNGLSWQGRFGELPPDIRQKINFLLENENLTLSPDTTLKIIIVPYVGLLTNHGEGSTYTEWFHLLAE
jgi:hypothetical protein